LIKSNDPKFNGNPAYAIEIKTKNNHVNRNDDFSIDIYISGAGNVECSKLKVSIPDDIVKDDQCELAQLEYGGINIPINNFIPSTNKISLRPSHVIGLSNIYFCPEGQSLANIGEINFRGQAPFTIKFRIAEDASGGDHNIYINLFYKFNDSWYIEKQNVPIHVNQWYEAELIHWVAICALLIGILASILKITNFFLGFGCVPIFL
jgi:hypothetical protein